MDRIVFNQTELDSIGAAHCTIALCDNSFVISPTNGTQYIAIGEVSAVVDCSAIEAISMGMTFVGFTPVFSGKCVEKAVKPEPVVCVNAPATSFASSYATSFKGSFTTSFASSFATSFTGLFTTSFATSFTGLFATSFASSFATSFTTSYSTSFAGMYEYEYELATSFPGSFSGSFKTGSFKNVSSFAAGSVGIIKKKHVVREIAVNGYGLNLI